MKQKAYL